MKLEIITPEKEYFSGEVESVDLPGDQGHMGPLPGHAPLVTMINDEWDDDLIYKVDKNSKDVEYELIWNSSHICREMNMLFDDCLVNLKRL